MNRWLSFALLLGIIVAVSIVFYQVMIGFVLPLFLAAILVIVFRPLHAWLLRTWPGRDRLAAALTTTAVVLIVIVPTTLLLTMAALEASSLPQQLRDQKLRQKVADLRRKLELEYQFADEIRYLESSLDSLQVDAAHGASAHGEADAYDRLVEAAQLLQDRISEGGIAARQLIEVRQQLEILRETARTRLGTLQYQQALRESEEAVHRFKIQLLGGEFRAWLKEVSNPTEGELEMLSTKVFAGAPGFLRSVGGATTGFLLKFVVQGAIMILAMYFFLLDGPSMIRTAMRLSPLDDAHETELIEEFDRISRAVVLATLLSAVVQGILAGLGFWVAGVQSVFLLSMITMVFALVPFVGAASVWFPACLWLYFSEGRPWAAILLGIYGMLIVSSSDNLIKPWVLHGQSNLHPLLALLSVLGGVQALGPIGILVGPMVVVFMQTLLNILQREVSALQVSQQPVLEPPAAGQQHRNS